jgi:hypothetical protein
VQPIGIVTSFKVGYHASANNSTSTEASIKLAAGSQPEGVASLDVSKLRRVPCVDVIKVTVL